MTIYMFAAGNPQAGQTLGNSRQIIQQNIDTTQNTLAIDHRNSNLSDPGYHTVIHFFNQTSIPAGTSGSAQLMTQTVNSDQQLFFRSGSALGPFEQMTGNTNLAIGHVFCSGVIFNWGNVVLGSSAANIFEFPFPNNCWQVIISLSHCSTTSGARAAITVVSTSLTGFVYTYELVNIVGTPEISFFAIGN